MKTIFLEVNKEEIFSKLVKNSIYSFNEILIQVFDYKSRFYCNI